jgi:hypothetical protein
MENYFPGSSFREGWKTVTVFGVSYYDGCGFTFIDIIYVILQRTAVIGTLGLKH